MDTRTSQKILKEAIRIGNQLLEGAELDKDGMSWKTIIHISDSDVLWGKNDIVYTGVSGISLFFLELFKKTNDQKYLKASEEGLRWVYNFTKNNPSGSYGFITDRLGDSFIMLKVYEATKKKEYLQNALSIAKECPSPPENAPNDFLTGTSGTILALMHLHAATGEEWLLRKIDQYTGYLIDRTKAGKKGLYWDRIRSYIKGLCGFSHGAAGVGFVFLELGRYFYNPAFYWMAEQAFLYESGLFDKGYMNWPDLRKFKESEEDFKIQEKAYIEKNMVEFTLGGDMNAWCHGAAGIGFSRLRAYELLGSRLYKRELEIAVKKTIITDVNNENPSRSHIYCHGKGGNADLFIEVWKLFGDNRYLQFVEKIALSALKEKENSNYYRSGYGYASVLGKEDRSLFMGNSGIGYFYLRALDPANVPSILYPKLDAVLQQGTKLNPYTNITISPDEIKKRVVSKFFKSTLSIAEEVLPRKIKKHFLSEKSNRCDENNAFIKFIKNELSDSRMSENREALLDSFSYELRAFNIDRATISNAYLDMKSIVLAERANKLNSLGENEFVKLKLIIDPEIKLHISKWDWNSGVNGEWKNNVSIQDSRFVALFKPGSLGVSTTLLTPMALNVLSSFRFVNAVEDVVQDVLKSFGKIDESDKIGAVNAIYTQIRELISYNVLLQAD